MAAWLLVVGFCLLGLRGFAGQSLGPDPSPVLNTINQIAALSPEDGGKGLSAKIKGTVTYCDRDRGTLFIQTGSNALSIRIPVTRENDDFDPQPGQLVEVEGITVAGRNKCGLRSRAIRLMGQGEMPPFLDLNAQTLFSTAGESRWVQARGWIPNVNAAANRLSFPLIISPGQSIDVALNGGDTSEVKSLPGSLVEIRGVLSLRLNSSGRIAGARLSVNGLSDVQTYRTLPIVPLADVGAVSSKDDPFRVRGTVANHSLGQFLILRDASGSLRVPYRGLNYFNPGSLVEVFAYPLERRPELVLTNVMVKLVPPDTSNNEAVAPIIAPSGPNTNLIALTQVAQIRKLSPQEASRGYPVQVTGQVTFCDRGSYLHFIQDESCGIYFDLNRVENASSVRAGQRIQIQGFSGPGDYAPIIIGQSVRILKDDAFPTPESVSFGKLMSGNFDSQWVSLKGVVRNQWLTTNSSTLALYAGDGLMKAILPGLGSEAEAPQLIDAGIEIRGVCRTIFDERRRLQGVELEVPDWKQLSVREAAIKDPFKLSVRPINDLFQFHANADESHRTRLMGAVTLRCADGSVYLQDGSGGIQIQPSSATPALQVGTMVDVVGFPVIVDKCAMLQEALVHPLRDGAAVEPAELKPDTALEETLQATLVRFQGQVLGHFSHGSEEVLTVRFGQKPIDVVLETHSDQDQLADFAPGTIVRLTGVFASQPNSAGNFQSFRVLLRSSSDLTILSSPGWWTVRRTLWALAGAGAVLLLALGWVRSLRRQVRQRTKELHEEIEHHKATEAKLEAEIAERQRMETEVERSHKELLIASRQAGMAEVATSVLHNVGNVLNSVNVSAGLVGDKIRNSKISNIARVSELIKAHSTDLAHYLEHDPKGRQLPQYLGRLAQHLNDEQGAILSELDSLRKNVEHIKGIVGMQQSYAKVFGSAEPVKPTELVEDALRLNSGALVRHEVRVVREYESNLPDITVDKHKLLQILVNLICNAKKACDESIYPEKLLTVKIANGEGRLKISVIDNGVGIPKENLTKIFNHGFTTRKDGHGFGLHSGALAAKEMGGALVAHSDGPGKGASFTVELPVTKPNPA